MNKIYRIISKENQESLHVGYLISEDETSFRIRIQNGINSSIQSFQKNDFTLKSIYENGGNEIYKIITKNSNNQDIIINLSK
jgi:hypothetical protein